jgi:2-oxo-4-hydroxy-4-carboxy-5-ureidoimidazoline decarboxylase
MPDVGRRVTLAELNASDRVRFVAVLGGVFEDSPWVAERAWPRRPFASIDDLHRAMAAEVTAASRARQHALLMAHPDLGARVRMSGASAAEQSAAGLDGMVPEEVDRLRRLNGEYRARFGFPFLYAVKGSTPVQITAALEARLSASPDAERAEALRQTCRIARFRLDDLVDGAAPAGATDHVS